MGITAEEINAVALGCCVREVPDSGLDVVVAVGMAGLLLAGLLPAGKLLAGGITAVDEVNVKLGIEIGIDSEGRPVTLLS